MREAIEDAGSLYRYAARQPDVRRLHGRLPVFTIPAPGGESRWVVRHYHHGGALARLLGDRFLAFGRSRPLRELEASEAARSRGVETPRVIASATYRSGAIYRADLVSEEVADAADLAALLFGRRQLARLASEVAAEPIPAERVAGAGPRLVALAAAGRLVRSLEEAGIYHRDLNAKNILVRLPSEADSPPPGPVGEPGAWVLDLDACRVRADGTGGAGGPGPAGLLLRAARPLAPGGAGRRMLARLGRSLRKWERESGRALSEEEWGALERGYAAGEGW